MKFKNFSYSDLCSYREDLKRRVKSKEDWLAKFEERKLTVLQKLDALNKLKSNNRSHKLMKEEKGKLERDKKIYEDQLNKLKKSVPTLENMINDLDKLYLEQTDLFTELLKRQNANNKTAAEFQSKNSEIKEPLKQIVFDVLDENEDKIKSKLPKAQQKQNRVWEISNGQIYNRFFEQKYPDQKLTIIRYIKEYRNFT